MSIRNRIATVLVASIAIAALLVPGLAFADPGAGIDKGSIAFPNQAHPGATYQLDTVTIFNTGDEAATYEMLVVPINTKGKLSPDASWITFSPQKFLLTPGSHRQVTVTMKLPASAAPGSYEALLGGRPIRPAGGVFVNVGAAARFKMQIAQSNFVAATYYGTVSYLHATAPWSYVAIATVVIALAITIFAVVRARFVGEYEDDEDDDEDDYVDGREAA